MKCRGLTTGPWACTRPKWTLLIVPQACDALIAGRGTWAGFGPKPRLPESGYGLSGPFGSFLGRAVYLIMCMYSILELHCASPKKRHLSRIWKLCLNFSNWALESDWEDGYPFRNSKRVRKGDRRTVPSSLMSIIVKMSGLSRDDSKHQQLKSPRTACTSP